MELLIKQGGVGYICVGGVSIKKGRFLAYLLTIFYKLYD